MRRNRMKIELEVSEECEGTSYPWWMIVTPVQNLDKGRAGASRIAMGAITGPFFSRESAESYLKATRYNFGKGTVVWCASGHESREYRQAIDNAEAAK
jgi:hypothetical protein